MASCYHKALPSPKMLPNPAQVITDCEEIDRVVRILLLEVVHRLLEVGLAGHPLAQHLLAELDVVGPSDVESHEQDFLVNACN